MTNGSAETAAFLMGEYVKGRDEFRRLVTDLRAAFRIVPAYAGDLEEDDLLEAVVDTRLQEWQLSHPASREGFRRCCQGCARHLFGRTLTGGDFVRACVLVEPYWFVTLRPGADAQPEPAVDSTEGEAHVLRRTLAFCRTWIDNALDGMGPGARDAFEKELHDVKCAAREQARHLDRVVIEVGAFHTVGHLRQALPTLEEPLDAARRKAHPFMPPDRVLHYAGDVRKNFRWYRQWKQGRSIAEITASHSVDRSHVSRVVHGIDHLLKSADPAAATSWEAWPGLSGNGMTGAVDTACAPPPPPGCTPA